MKKDNKKHQNNNNIVLICAIVIIAIALVFVILAMNQNAEEKEDVAYTQLIKDIDNELVEKIEMTVGSTTLTVTYKDRENDEDTETVIIPSTQAFVEYVQEKIEERKRP